MSTHYILAGGNDRAGQKYWQDLAKAVGQQEKRRVLSCLFARDEDWQTFYKGYIPYFKMAFGEDITVEVADPNLFDEQVKRADIIYLHGGDTRKLKKYLEPYDVKELFKGKIVVGSSAGSQFIGKKYWSCGVRRTGDGRGLIPLNTIVHFDSDFGSDDPRGPIDWAKAKAEFQKEIGDEKITTIPEGEFVEFTV